MSGGQLAFGFEARPAYRADDFLVAPCNRAAVAWLDRWPDWPGGGLVIHGPRACGKSHLVEVWRTRSDARVIAGEALVETLSAHDFAPPHALAVDDADRVAESTALLHLFNAVTEDGGTVLLSASAPATVWAGDLPSWSSRLRALPAVAVALPDDTVLAAVMAKQFADRQIRVDPAVITYLLARMKRTFACAQSLVAALDRRSLGAGRPITVRLARELLAEFDNDGSPPD